MGPFARHGADQVNEVQYEGFADTVVEFVGEKATLVEDFADEVRGLLG